MFDHEKLDVYQLSLHFLSWVTPLLQEVTQSHGAKVRETSDHLDRASLSILLNTAEGNGKRRRLVRAKFFDDARGSATECAACLDALVAKGMTTKERVAEGKEILVRVVSMLTKLVQLYETESTLKEDAAEYQSN
jgi:four helix bundle protein